MGMAVRWLLGRWPVAGYRVGAKNDSADGLLGQNQLVVLRDPKTVLVAAMFNDDLAAAPEQVGSADPLKWRRQWMPLRTGGFHWIRHQ